MDTINAEHVHDHNGDDSDDMTREEKVKNVESVEENVGSRLDGQILSSEASAPYNNYKGMSSGELIDTARQDEDGKSDVRGESNEEVKVERTESGPPSLLHQLISETRALVCHLREQERRADVVISSAHHLHLQLMACKEYSNEVEVWAAASRHHPRTHLLASIQLEGQVTRSLQDENEELRSMLEEQQHALHIVMDKYQEQRGRIDNIKGLEDRLGLMKDLGENVKDEVEVSNEKVKEMAAVMQHAVTLEEEAEKNAREELNRLRDENFRLRNQLGFTSQSEASAQTVK